MIVPQLAEMFQALHPRGLGGFFRGIAGETAGTEEPYGQPEPSLVRLSIFFRRHRTLPLLSPPTHVWFQHVSRTSHKQNLLPMCKKERVTTGEQAGFPTPRTLRYVKWGGSPEPRRAPSPG